MSKSRYRWWGYVRHMVRDYQKLIDAKHLTVDDQKDRDAVTKAIDIARQQPKGEELLTLIRDVYWNNGGLRINDAALHLYISEITAKRWHSEFIRLVGKCWGFTVADEEESDEQAQEHSG